MKAGEYVGADGGTYEWRVADVRDGTGAVAHLRGASVYHQGCVRIRDLRAAAAALVALADELETEVFALDEQTRLRVRDNDVLLERALGTAPVWAPSNTGEADRILAAFRAGRWREKA
jgi:hypothetical protein